MAITVEKSIVGTLRLVLANIVTAEQVVTVGLIMANVSNVIITGCRFTEIRPSEFACGLIFWVVASGGAARLMYMTTFAISVYVLIRYSARKMKIWFAIVAVIGVWLAVLLPNASMFSSDIIDVTFTYNDTCAAHGTGYTTFIYAFGYTTVYGLLGFAVSVFCVTAIVWFIQHDTISGDVTLVKAMLEFAVFLVLGNVINFAGQAIPLLFAAFAPAAKGSHNLEKAFNYVEGLLILISLVPTPVLILIYFRPVRKRIKRILCGVCGKKAYVSEKTKTGETRSSSTGNAPSGDADMYIYD